MDERPDEPEGGGDGEGNRQYTVLTEHEEVRTWADERELVPVRNTERPEDARAEFVHGDELESHHEEQEWETFLDEFDRRNLAVTYTAGDSGGTDEHRLVDRSELVDEHGDVDDALVRELLAGETVETEVTEREVVETEVVETATIESELTDTEVVDTEVVDTEIVDEELVSVAVAEATDAEVVDGGGRRYFDEDSDEVIVIEEEGAVVLEIDETRVETREELEKKIIESRVVDENVETETRVEEEETAVDIDDADVHEHIRESGLIDTRSDEVVDERYLETEFDEDNVATSTLTERKTVEDVVEERKVVIAEVTDVGVEASEVVESEVVDTEIVETDIDAVAGGRGDIDTATSSRGESTEGSSMGESPEASEHRTSTDSTPTDQETDRTDEVDISRHLMGRSVRLPDGEEIGIVSDVDADTDLLYVDTDPSLTDKMKAFLDWSDEEDASALPADQIREIRHDAVVVENEGVDGAEMG